MKKKKKQIVISPGDVIVDAGVDDGGNPSSSAVFFSMMFNVGMPGARFINLTVEVNVPSNTPAIVLGVEFMPRKPENDAYSRRLACIPFGTSQVVYCFAAFVKKVF